MCGATEEKKLQAAEEQVQREGYAIRRLCSEARELIGSGRVQKTYLTETEGFLNFLVRILSIIDEHAKNSIDNIIEGGIPKEIMKSQKRALGSIKASVRLLYTYAKEALDADTLSIPFSIATFLNHNAKEIMKPTNASLIIMTTPDLNYYQEKLGNLRRIIDTLREGRVNELPELPEEFGLLRFPYSTAREVLINCLLFHELGHFVYEKGGFEKKFFKIFEAKWDCFLQENAEIINQTHEPLLAARYCGIYARNRLRSWANEVFSDILAIRTLGPAYHLACLEMFPTEGNKKEFSSTHPAIDYRFRKQANWLKRGKWYPILKNRAPEILEALEVCEILTVNSFQISPEGLERSIEDILHPWMLKQFEEIVADIEKEIENKFFEVAEKPPIDDFNYCDSFVTNYLEHGIVPSSVYAEDQDKIIHPAPTTMLNSGFFFYLGGMEKLLEKVQDASDKIQIRMNCEKRLNEWLAKGIEDWQIMRPKQKGKE